MTYKLYKDGEVPAEIIERARKSCTCHTCVEACYGKPGWFKPGEAEKVAEYKDLTMEELFRDWLGVDWWDDDINVFVLAPAMDRMEAGGMYPGDPKGACIFLDKDTDRCTIHEVKPFECRKMIHGERQTHVEVKNDWDSEEHAKQIYDLLGEEPEAEEYYGGGLFGGIFG